MVGGVQAMYGGALIASVTFFFANFILYTPRIRIPIIPTYFWCASFVRDVHLGTFWGERYFDLEQLQTMVTWSSW